MWRALDDASIHVKLLITPGLVILALALVSAGALRGYTAETALTETVVDLTQNQLRHASDGRLLAAGLQATMFRFTTMGLMGAPRTTLEPLDTEIRRCDVALGAAIAAIAADEPQEAGARLTAALAIFRTQSSQAATNFLNNPGWGATTARNAAMALDAVIEEIGQRQREVEANIAAAEAANSALNRRQRANMLWLLGIGSPLMLAGSLVAARRIAEPIRRLTAVMTRLAHRQYEGAVPSIGQQDEIGSMARAVQIFKDGLLRADALARQQRATQVFLDTVLEHVPATIFVKSAKDLSYVHVNRAAEAFIGMPREKLLGRTSHDVMPAGDADPILARDIEALAAAGTIVDDGVVLATAGNGDREATVTRVAIAGPDGGPQYLLAMIEDVTERRRAEQRIAHMAHYDALTDLPNRALFAESLADAVRDARRHGTQVAVLGLDLDHFKEVNDTLGHAAGDALLRAVTARLRACLREGDTLARLGGDEFAVIQAPVRRGTEAEALAERLLETVHRPFEIERQQVYIGLSCGIALSTPATEVHELVKQADLALYDAKESGRNCFRWFVPEMDEQLQQRRAMETALRAAMGTGQLTLHYQPQVDLASSAILGAEALMRWSSPRHGEVPPSAFIAIAEDTGLIGPLGEWLLQAACSEAMRWPAHLRVAVNVSPVQLRLPGFLEAIRRALVSTGLDPHRLELEVTEGILLRDTAGTLAIFAELRALGVLLALDDFGTGYTSLSYLQKFRFDKIKIDRSFVKDLDTDAKTSAIVRAVIGLSEALGMRTNAEGVETEAELALLTALGCREAQGYYFWRPMTAASMLTLVSDPGEVRFSPPAAAA